MSLSIWTGCSRLKAAPGKRATDDSKNDSNKGLDDARLVDLEQFSALDLLDLRQELRMSLVIRLGNVAD